MDIMTIILGCVPLNCQTNPSNVGKAIVNYPQFYRIRVVLSINPYEWFILSLRTVRVLSSQAFQHIGGSCISITLWLFNIAMENHHV